MSTSLITGYKTPEQLDIMRQGGKILAQIFQDIRGFVEVGVTENEINDFVGQKINEYGASPTYRTPEVGFPANICVCTNDEIVHSIPTDYEYRQGDVATFDLVITYKGMKVDSAFTMVVGEKPAGAKKLLLSATERALYAGIDSIYGATYTGTIGYAIEKVLKNAKLGIVKELVGHGIGLEMHMPPDVPNHGRPNTGVLLQPGDTVAIEPMATLGSAKIILGDDDWTYSTRDGSLAAQFEHTVLITEEKPEILTKL